MTPVVLTGLPAVALNAIRTIDPRSNRAASANGARGPWSTAFLCLYPEEFNDNNLDIILGRLDGSLGEDLRTARAGKRDGDSITLNDTEAAGWRLFLASRAKDLNAADSAALSIMACLLLGVERPYFEEDMMDAARSILAKADDFDAQTAADLRAAAPLLDRLATFEPDSPYDM